MIFHYQVYKNNKIYMTNSLNEFLTDDSCILAGTKVIDKVGGPNMVIVGLSSHPNYVENDKLKSTTYLCQKVFVNVERKSFGELNEEFSGNDNRFSYFFFKDLYEEIKIYDIRPNCSNELYLICKYWSNQDNEYKYVNKTLPELEIIL